MKQQPKTSKRELDERQKAYRPASELLTDQIRRCRQKRGDNYTMKEFWANYGNW